MSLQDLVAAECAQPNQLANFVNNFTSDKYHLHEDVWERDKQHTFDNARTRLRQEDEDLDEDEFEREADRRFFRNESHPGPGGMFDPNEYDSFMKDAPDMHGPPENDHMLASILKSFVSGSHSQHMRALEELPDLGLSDRDKTKIRDRAGIMSRHFYADQGQDFADEQMRNLMHALRIGGRHIDDRALEDSWREGTRTVTSTAQGAQWAKQYSTDRASEEFDDYDEIIRNTSENKLWLEENSQMASPNRWAKQWENEYHRGEGRAWINDYTTKSDRQIEEDTLESAWNDASHDRLMEAAWGDGEKSVNRGRANARNLTELTDAITKIDDPKLQASNFMQFMHKINRGQVTFGDNKVIEQDFAPTSDGLINNDWVQQYDKFDEEDFNTDFSTEFNDPREWAREYESFEGSISADRLAEYEFVVNSASNPYSTHDDPFSAAIELFNKGMITEAILAFEMEVQKNPKNSAAWQALGQAHAENDKDNLAILSLEKAVEVDPENLDALAALAVSYTNDFSRDKALEALEKWLTLNPEYTHIPPSVNPNSRLEGVPDFYQEAWSRHARVVEMFLQAAQIRPDDPDPEVQTALGLLYNLSYEYDKAVDCFKAALTKRPADYHLWNKLGATLANSNRGEEALGAYFKALEGKPTYVRARANLGISFLALNSYNEAAESFLSALKLHPNAGHLWDNLKMVFRLMGREDLEARAAHNDIEAFGESFRM